MKKTLLTIVAIFAIIICGYSQVTGVAVGAIAPDFTVTDVHGRTHKLSDYTSQGKNVILDFFFIGCGACELASPKINEFYHKYGCNKGNIIVLGMDMDSDNAAVIKFENQFTGDNPYPSCSGNEGGGSVVNNTYRPNAYPTICLIGSDGTLKNNDIWNDDVTLLVGLMEDACAAAGITLTPMDCNVATEKNEKASYSLAPNPVSNILYINGCDVRLINVFNAQGKFISTHKNTYKIDVSSYTEGLYLVEIVSSKGLISKQKFVVKR